MTSLCRCHRATETSPSCARCTWTKTISLNLFRASGVEWLNSSSCTQYERALAHLYRLVSTHCTILVDGISGLNYNQISGVPSEIGRLTKLEVLYVKSRTVSSPSRSIILTCRATLMPLPCSRRLMETAVESLPASIGKLSKLRVMYVMLWRP